MWSIILWIVVQIAAATHGRHGWSLAANWQARFKHRSNDSSNVESIWWSCHNSFLWNINVYPTSGQSLQIYQAPHGLPISCPACWRWGVDKSPHTRSIIGCAECMQPVSSSLIFFRLLPLREIVPHLSKNARLSGLLGKTRSLVIHRASLVIIEASVRLVGRWLQLC